MPSLVTRAGRSCATCCTSYPDVGRVRLQPDHSRDISRTCVVDLEGPLHDPIAGGGLRVAIQSSHEGGRRAERDGVAADASHLHATAASIRRRHVRLTRSAEATARRQLGNPLHREGLQPTGERLGRTRALDDVLVAVPDSHTAVRVMDHPYAARGPLTASAAVHENTIQSSRNDASARGPACRVPRCAVRRD